MKSRGIQKAKSDLTAAKEALAQLRSASNLEAADDAWTSFVEKYGRFFNKLAAAAKGNPKSEGWVQRLNQARSSDEMLNYLLQARNCVEHSIEDLAHKDPGYFSISGAAVYIDHIFEVGDRLVGKAYGTPDARIESRPPSLRLLPITNRGVVYAVPSLHQANAIDSSPIMVAQLAIAFGEQALADANKLTV